MAQPEELIGKASLLQTFRGVLDGVIEERVVADLCKGSIEEKVELSWSAARIAREYATQGIGVRVLSAKGQALPDSLPKGAAAPISEALAAGRVVVVPERPVSLGGWVYTSGGSVASYHL